MCYLIQSDTDEGRPDDGINAQLEEQNLDEAMQSEQYVWEVACKKAPELLPQAYRTDWGGKVLRPCPMGCGFLGLSCKSCRLDTG